jgi:hypothetical protein
MGCEASGEITKLVSTLQEASSDSSPIITGRDYAKEEMNMKKILRARPIAIGPKSSK